MGYSCYVLSELPLAENVVLVWLSWTGITIQSRVQCTNVDQLLHNIPNTLVLVESVGQPLFSTYPIEAHILSVHGQTEQELKKLLSKLTM